MVALLAQQPRVITEASRGNQVDILRHLLEYHGAVVTRLALEAADVNARVHVIDLFIALQPHVVARLCSDTDM